MTKLISAFLFGLLLATQVVGQEPAEEKEPAPKMPYEFPSQKLDAKVGQYILYPPRKWVDAAVEKGADKTTMIWYTAKLESAGPEFSVVKSLAGTSQVIPNPMLIPIQTGQTAAKGDVLLTWWQGGSGMQRAFVTGGTPTEPVVRFLDLDYDNPAGIGQKEYKLKPDSFHKLTKEWQRGTAVSAKVGSRHRHGQLINVSDDKVMMVMFGGKTGVFPKSDCKPLPVRLEVKTGDKVYAPVFGSMKEVEVVKVDEAIGRVFVKFKFGSSEKEEAIAFGDLVKSL